MIKVETLSEIKESFALTIGNFDGVHQGHSALLKELKLKALENDFKLVVMTFIPHPSKILRQTHERFLLASYERRRDLLAELGVDYLVEIDFTRDFSTLHPQEFMDQYIFPHKNLKGIYLGHDFAFGANKEGSFEFVKKLCRDKEIELCLQSKFLVNGQLVSSTLIRNHLGTGEVADVQKFLGRHFGLEGVVIKGEGRGKKIGFPTANIQIDPDLLIPARGVYVTQTEYRDMKFSSVTNIGFNPTFNDGKTIHVETFIFDFDSDIYGEGIEVKFFEKIRNEKKFPTVNDLIAQLKEDVKYARDYFKN